MFRYYMRNQGISPHKRKTLEIRLMLVFKVDTIHLIFIFYVDINSFWQSFFFFFFCGNGV
jgi:hypothetical protein